MTIKSVLFTATLALASMTVAGAKGAKTYDVVFASPAKVATQQLQAGEYRMKIDGANATFTNVENGRSVTVPVKVENGAKKFDLTAIESQKTGDTEQVQSIDLGGTSTTVGFE